MLLEDSDSANWFRLNDGVARLRDGHANEFRWGFGPAIMIQQDRPGRYWLGTFSNGVLDFSPRDSTRMVSYPLPDGTTAYEVRAMLNAIDGNLWIGSARNGLLR